MHKEIDTHTHTHTHTYTRWNITQPQKKNEILPFATTWMEVLSMMLSEITEKNKYHMILLVWNLRNKTNKGKKKERNQA